MEENANGSSTHVTVRVQMDGQKDVSMRIRRSIPLAKVLCAYCRSLGVETDTMRFTVDGKRINGLETVGDLGLKDGDILDAWSDQFGGGGGGGSST